MLHTGQGPAFIYISLPSSLVSRPAFCDACRPPLTPRLRLLDRKTTSDLTVNDVSKALLCSDRTGSQHCTFPLPIFSMTGDKSILPPSPPASPRMPETRSRTVDARSRSIVPLAASAGTVGEWQSASSYFSWERQPVLYPPLQTTHASLQNALLVDPFVPSSARRGHRLSYDSYGHQEGEDGAHGAYGVRLHRLTRLQERLQFHPSLGTRLRQTLAPAIHHSVSLAGIQKVQSTSQTNQRLPEP